MFGVTRAPELDQPGLTWLNTPVPLSLAALAGRLVVLDFWTFCCINCMHVLPALKRLEESFPLEVAVIGVHSPKFAAERDPEKVAAAIRRYGIAHPVVHDPEFTLWRAYAVRAWPTLVFIAPDGRVVGQNAGEPDPDRLIAAVAEALAGWRAEGRLRPEALALAAPAEPAGRFRFPGKLKPVPGAMATAAQRWALADAGHHQIALLDAGGGEIRRFGSGRPGFIDGTAEIAAFDGPQGLIADAAAIYVADTGNHALRRIDLASGAVTTLAGTGRRGRGLSAPSPARTTALASPWDLEQRSGRLFFANAGTHQLGVLDLAEGTVARLAGSGAEAILDGREAEAALAQPSGLALSGDGRTLYFVDSETSAVRALTLGAGDGSGGTVTTLIGTGLFDFGHINGPFAGARLQHPLGIAWWQGWLAIADSYNDGVRIIDFESAEIGDLDDGFLCTDPICVPPAEPAGIAAAGDRLLLVDTNNHRVLEYHVSARRCRTWAA